MVGATASCAKVTPADPRGLPLLRVAGAARITLLCGWFIVASSISVSAYKRVVVGNTTFEFPEAGDSVSRMVHSTAKTFCEGRSYLDQPGRLARANTFEVNAAIAANQFSSSWTCAVFSSPYAMWDPSDPTTRFYDFSNGSCMWGQVCFWNNPPEPNGGGNPWESVEIYPEMKWNDHTTWDPRMPVCEYGPLVTHNVTYCPPGTYYKVFAKYSCPAIPSCPAGQFFSAVDGCTDCAPGTFASNATPVMSCTPCGKGQYQPNRGASACVECSPGYFQNRSGLRECSTCPPGMFQNNSGQVNCTVCPRHSYSDEANSSTCTACPLGSFTTAGGATSRLLCVTPSSTESERSPSTSHTASETLSSAASLSSSPSSLETNSTSVSDSSTESMSRNQSASDKVSASSSVSDSQSGGVSESDTSTHSGGHSATAGSSSPSQEATASRSATWSGTIVAFGRPALRPPLNALVDASRQALVASIALSGAPVAALRLQRTNAVGVTLLFECSTAASGEESAAAEPLPWIDSPTRLTIGSDRNRYFLGALLGNSILLVAFVVLHGGVASLIFWKVRAASVHTFDEAHQRLRFPGLQFAPWMILLSPTSMSLAASLATRITAGSVGLSIAAGVVVIIVPCAAITRVCVHVHSCEEVVRIRKQIPGPQWYARLRHWLFHEAEAWPESPFALRWGLVYEDRRLPWTVLIEVAACLVLSITTGVAAGQLGPPANTTSCRVAAVSAIICAALNFSVHAYYRPFLAHFDGIHTCLSCALELTVAALATSVVVGALAYESGAVSYTVLAQVIVGVIGVIVWFFSTVVEPLRRHLCRRRKKREKRRVQRDVEMTAPPHSLARLTDVDDAVVTLPGRRWQRKVPSVPPGRKRRDRYAAVGRDDSTAASIAIDADDVGAAAVDSGTAVYDGATSDADRSNPPRRGAARGRRVVTVVRRRSVSKQRSGAAGAGGGETFAVESDGQIEGLQEPLPMQRSRRRVKKR